MSQFNSADLHPGAAVALKRHSMDETQLAQAIASGALTSPQKFGNSWYFAIRITGVGASYRSALKEYVWRDPKIYLNQHFLDRSRGLPVIVEHPDKMMLDTGEYRRRNIGTVVLPYIGTERGEDKEASEVWGIARILDAPAARYMIKHDLSTSPAVVFGNSAENEKIELKDGEHLLIEGKPKLLDHIAIVTAGVWDKAGPPSGIASDEVGTAGHAGKKGESVMADMTEEEKKAAEEREDKARRDAEGETLDKILTGLDGMSKRMDALEAEARHGKQDDDDPSDKETEERQAAQLRELAAEEEEEAEAAEDAAADARARDDDDTKRDDAAHKDDTKRRIDAAKRRHDRAKARFDAAHKKLADGKARDDDAKHDASHKRFDAAGKKLDDCAGYHDTKRKDMKRDDAKHDEDDMPFEESERKDGESDGAFSKRVHDAASKRSDKHPWMKRDDESIAAHCDRIAHDSRRDRARRDAEEMVSKAKTEAEEAKADAAAARAENKETRALLDEMRTALEDRPIEEEAQLADAQARADGVYMALGQHAPRPMHGETLIGYRTRLTRGLQKFSKVWKEEDLLQLARHSPTAFDAAERQVYADSMAASNDPSMLGDGGSGSLHKVITRDDSGREMIEWRGDPLAWMGDFMQQNVKSVTRLGKQ